MDKSIVVALMSVLTSNSLFGSQIESIPFKDPHSYANASEIRVEHVSLDLDVDFGKKELAGFATLKLRRLNPGAPFLVLDSRNLHIERVESSRDGLTWDRAEFHIGENDKFLGSPVTIQLRSDTKAVRLHYRTDPDAMGVQWLNPAQTAGKKLPFLFTQSESIQARSWIPLQDSPSIRITYDARIRTPKELRAVMSADQKLDAPRTGDYRFQMHTPIPSYLIALAVGDLDFQSLGERCGVFADPTVLPKAAKELEDTQKMIEATERLYGPYRWGRYDILILPPSFPFGGMENPRLTFATPTMLAGDKSLVSLISHELAHSWSGNLVTNATWSDLWLNEGFTTYLERRIVEAVYGKDRAVMEVVLGRQILDKQLKEMDPADTILNLNLDNRDPDDGMNEIPYEKGSLLLRTLEDRVGRTRFDAFLRGYFAHFAFRSIRTADFEEYFREHLSTQVPDFPLEQWVHQPGIPEGASVSHSQAFDRVDEAISQFIGGQMTADALPAKTWSTQEWLHFLHGLPETLALEKMRGLDAAWHLTSIGNAEIAHVWLLISIRRVYEPAYARLEEYLVDIGRRKLIVPLYEALIKSPEGKKRALDIYAKARPGYHPIAQGTLDKLLR